MIFVVKKCQETNDLIHRLTITQNFTSLIPGIITATTAQINIANVQQQSRGLFGKLCANYTFIALLRSSMCDPYVHLCNYSVDLIWSCDVFLGGVWEDCIFPPVSHTRKW